MRDALVICYHGVSEDWPSDLAIQPGQLEAQISWYLDRGYRPVTFTEAATVRAAERVIAVTFDDGYRSVLQLALPLLARMGVRGTVFAPTALVGESEAHGWDGTRSWASTRWAGEIQVMGWDELDQLVAAGWEIGSHTRTHPHLTQLDDGQLLTELRRSREEIEENLGGPCTSIAYPYGATDSRVARAAGLAGYRAGGGLLPNRLHARDPLLFPRVFAGRYLPDSTLHRRAGPAFRRLQGSVAWPWVVRAVAVKQSLRRLLGKR